MVGVRGCTRIHRHLAVEKPKERQRLFKWFGSRQARAPSAATNVSSSQQIAKSLDALVVEADRLQAHNDYAGIVTLLIPESARFSSHAALLTTLGFALYMLARYREAIRVLDQALALEPANHGALKFMVGSMLSAGEYALGITYGTRAIAVGAADEQVYNALGAMQLNLGNVEEAIQAFETSVKLNPHDTQALANLETVKLRYSALRTGARDSAEVARIRQQWIATLAAQLRDGSLSVEGAERLSQMIGIKQQHWPLSLELVDKFSAHPDLSAILAANLASTCFYAGRTANGMALSETAWRLAPGLPEVRNAFGSRLVREGGSRWNQGWRLMAETNRMLFPNNYVDDSRQWTGQSIGDAKLFVHLDQGVGDTFIALRMLRRLAERGIKVVLWVPPIIAEVVDTMAPLCEIVSSELMPHPATLDCSYSCGLFDLLAGLALRPSDIGAFDTLSAHTSRLEQWRDRVISAHRPVFALIASGNPRREDDWIRSVPPSALQPLADVEGVTWVNLSTDARLEIEIANRMLKMVDPTPEIKDFADTAAVLSLVDGVVAIDCATAHLAGALGKPLWVLKPTMDDWRWQIGDVASPWWPSARVFKSTEAGEWQQPVSALSADVQQYLAARASSDPALAGIGAP
jgi:tetratricopeptide (TPR) repeat protein